MTLEADFEAALEVAYQTTGRDIDYWARRYIQAVRKNGGVVQAKKMLGRRSKNQRKGLDKLLEAGRAELSIESIVLQPRFHSLFTDDERATAAKRLTEFHQASSALRASRERLFPDELEPGQRYFEGARKSVRVNAYERDKKARKACIAKHGTSCSVCGFNFEDRYGSIGRGFIHIHHLNPLALTDGEYELNPENDLRPVCPNCHAMLHSGEAVLTIEELMDVLRTTG